jgi:hypothetical protein
LLLREQFCCCQLSTSQNEIQQNAERFASELRNYGQFLSSVHVLSEVFLLKLLFLLAVLIAENKLKMELLYGSQFHKYRSLRCNSEAQSKAGTEPVILN